MLNKKGSLQVVVFVVLSFLVVFSSLFIFYINSRKTVNEISDIGLMNNLIIEKNLFDSYASDFIEKALYLSYNEFVDKGGYSDNARDSDLNILFGSLNKEVNSDFSIVFEKNLLFLFEREYSNDFLLKLNEFIKEKEYSFYFDGEEIFFNFSQVSLREDSEKINLVYTPLISVEKSFRDMGLNNFNEIYFAKEECKNFNSIGETEFCFQEKLKFFQVSVSEIKISDDKSRFLVSLESKRDFLIDNNKNKINFEFIVI